MGRLPDRVPIHWNLAGEPNGWASPLGAALLLPGVLTGAYLLILAYDWGGLDFKAARAMSPATTRAIRILLLLLGCGIQGAILGASLGQRVPTSTPVLLGLALFFVALGNLLPRLEPNAWVGIRVPPTLESREVWKRTHRLGGMWMVGAGLIGLPASLLPPRFADGVVLAIVCVPLVAAVVYAYWLRHRLAVSRTPPSEVP